MTDPPLRTVLVGMGKVGAGYADDPVMARHFPYASHAQVLADHPDFVWDAVVDVDDRALMLARERWVIPHVARRVDQLPDDYCPDVAVIATPPDSRAAIVERFDRLSAVLVEKPLGKTVEAGARFVEVCCARGIKVQVNLWRRADRVFRSLARGRMERLIGEPQAVFGVYGNGLLNNGTHMVDFARMLLGEIEEASAVDGCTPYHAGPIPGDIHVPFHMRFQGGVVAMVQPVRFEHFRENALDVWGTRGRMSVLQEGLRLQVFPRKKNRGMWGEREVASDSPHAVRPTSGHAFYDMYSNLADAVCRGADLWSPAESALRTASVVEEIIRSARPDGGCRPCV